MRVLDGQMCLELFEKPAPMFLCDKCKKLVWHSSGDGYCCCLAPGMAYISAKRRKPMNANCHFYVERVNRAS